MTYPRLEHRRWWIPGRGQQLWSQGAEKGPGNSSAEAKSVQRCGLQLKTFKQCSSWWVFVDMEPGCNAFGVFKTLQLAQSGAEGPCSTAVGGTPATAGDQQHPLMGVCKMKEELSLSLQLAKTSMIFSRRWDFWKWRREAEVQVKEYPLLLHWEDNCHRWNNPWWKEERCDPSSGEGTQPGPRGCRQGETPSQPRWRDYQNMNANGVFMAFTLAFDEHLNVLPETML